MGFTKTKDRAFNTYNALAGWLSRRSRPVRYCVYYIVGAIFWIAYFLPGNTVRPTMAALARRSDQTSGISLFRKYVSKLIRGAELAERVRHGFGEEIDGILTIKDKRRFEGMLAKGGLFLGLPHLHASVALTYNLARDYPLLLIVGLPTDPKRAAAQQRLYEQLGCDFLDARNEPAGSVARKTLRALRSGKIVVGTIDRLRTPPDEPVDVARGQVRASVFGQKVGVESWTSRFAMEASVPVVPATVQQRDKDVVLILGNAVQPAGDLVETSQNWVNEMVRLLVLHPEEWTFSLDKHWARVLTSAASD